MYMQLEGGIHRYLEQYPDGGIFEGKNYVFDQRVLTAPAEYNNYNSNEVTSDGAGGSIHTNSNDNVGKNTSNININNHDSNSNNILAKCQYCTKPYDQVSRDRVCCVCRHDVIVCDDCVKSNPYCSGGMEFHCEIHRQVIRQRGVSERMVYCTVRLIVHTDIYGLVRVITHS